MLRVQETKRGYNNNYYKINIFRIYYLKKTTIVNIDLRN